MDIDGLLHEAILQTFASGNTGVMNENIRAAENIRMAENVRAYENNGVIKDENKYVTMCYVPMQQWEELYDEDTAYKVGTAFPSLNKPFAGGGK